ncbi:NAD-dependent epimerase/dehydratase family protein [Streptomyces sanyensis]|uniref:NAD-dependent epimerase/dehydratase family protein n=1 Tax=Streptomyces sanyensis TaxID=568869 RepID=UPI003D77CE03
MPSDSPERARPLIALLGASGFVGSWVLRELSARPVRLRAVARRPVRLPSGPAHVESRSLDLTAPGAVAEAVAGADVVISLVIHSGGWRAAEHDPAARAVNEGVMASVLASLRDRPGGRAAPVVVYAGAASQLGVPPREPIGGGEPDHPETAYDRQKLAAERLLLDATREGAVRGVALRLPTVFGESAAPGADDRGVVSFMARRALAGQRLTMWHDGTVTRDLVHAEDIARAFASAIDHPDALSGAHWPLGAGRGDRLGDVFRTIARLAAGHRGGPPVPVVPVEPPAGAPATDFHGVTIDATRFRTATGWSPRIPLPDALARTVAGHATAEKGS